MALSPQQIEALAEASAAALGLPIAAQHRPGVLAFLALAATLAERVNGLPLGIEDEPAAVFVPVSPRMPPA